MKLFIPKVGDILTLKKAWKFSLFSERRNYFLGKAFDLLNSDVDQKVYDALWKVQNTSQERYKSLDVLDAGKVTLPKGTELKIDRIYIRKGYTAECNSVSFWIVAHPDKKFLKKRFWARLEDVNTMEVTHV